MMLQEKNIKIKNNNNQDRTELVSRIQCDEAI